MSIRSARALGSRHAAPGLLVGPLLALDPVVVSVHAFLAGQPALTLCESFGWFGALLPAEISHFAGMLFLQIGCSLVQIGRTGVRHHCPLMRA